MKILQILRKENEKEEEEEEKNFCMEKESTNMKIISINCGSVIFLLKLFQIKFSNLIINLFILQLNVTYLAIYVYIESCS